jgi:inhibitor of cysteine peptidase
MELTAEESFSDNPEGLMGAPVTTVWKFEAKAEGETTLSFLYFRSWEGKESAIKKEEYVLVIEE